jgi:hypothetical protein
MTMEKDKLNNQDDKIKEILSFSKIKAGENLKYRIMQQIETESVFAAKKSEGTNLLPIIGNSFLIIGIMCALVVVVALGVYIVGGIDALNSAMFFGPVIMVSIICSMFWMISILDDKKRLKQEHKSR